MSYITIKPLYTRRSIDKYIGEKRDCRINVSVEERERIQPWERRREKTRCNKSDLPTWEHEITMQEYFQSAGTIVYLKYTCCIMYMVIIFSGP